MVETIYIARHGFRLNWVTSNWKSETGIPRDPPLAAFGLTQAQELADHFLSLPLEERPTAILSSPYYRCLQTAKPVAVALGVPIYVEHGLSEWYSPVVPGTGLHPRPPSATALRAWFPEIDDTWSSIWYPSRKGEDVEEVHDRANGYLSALVPEIERRFPAEHKKILLVTHAATAIALTRELVGDRALAMRVGCCTLTELSRPSDRANVVGEWIVQRLADGSHLKDGSQRDWGFEDIVIANGKVVQDPGSVGTENDLEQPVGLQATSVNSRL
ncbi:hypothetical protein CERSUDRAFT_102220 [Gelatoporia subvermispora B]|uniref:Phosphoglycerate mutase-like protein n=1 Tax=Ceriporiopsis subvermispora (strain B) TaxID=914234 RepID=M2PY53_CERS8|nr:hypothetical protein CERSUDRAFT_102220 [Gelatoporia subvermispora B]